MVKYIKKLTTMYTNLTEPKSMHLEDVVLLAEDDVVDTALYLTAGSGDLSRTTHFDLLMEAVLKVSTYHSSSTGSSVTPSGP